MTTTSYFYSNNGQLEKTVSGEQVENIKWPEETLIPESDGFKINNVNPIFTSGKQTLEIQEQNGQVIEVTNIQQTSVNIDKNDQQQVTQLNYKSSGNVESRFLYEYDDDGNLTKKIDTNRQKSETYEYVNGLKIAYTDMEGRKFFWSYDEAGNLITESVGSKENVVVTHTYNSKGQKITSTIEGTITRYEYDAQGNVTSVKIGSDEDYIVTRSERDKAGNNIRGTEGDELRVKSYTYDSNNKLTSISEERGQTNIVYDDAEGSHTVTDPLGRTTTVFTKGEKVFSGLRDPQGKEWRVGYDKQERIAWKKRPDGTSTQYTYDPSGLHIREITAEGVNQRKLCENKNILYAKNKQSNCKFKYNRSAQHIGYDVTYEGRKPIEIRYAVDATGIKRSMTTHTMRITEHVLGEDGKLSHYNTEPLSFGGDVNYAYDARGRLMNIVAGNFSIELDYGMNGGICAIRRGNKVHTQLTYTSFGYMKKATTSLDTQLLTSLDLEYDTGGNISSKIVDDKVILHYRYDGNDQLVGVAGPDGNQSYIYGKTGNRVRSEGEQLCSFQYDEHDVYLEECDLWGYQYDANGFLVRKTSKLNQEKHSYAYNAFGQLIGFTKVDEQGVVQVTVVYGYDALGRRIEKKVEWLNEPQKNVHLYFVYDGDNLLLEHSPDLSYWRKYIYLNQIDSLLGFVENGKAYYYLRDNQGNITHLLDESGEVAANYTYDCFGDTITENIADNAPENRFRYSSREWDPESQTYYFRNRTYDPHSGRFLQPDPYPGDAERPITVFNKYVFAGNNPLKYCDPYGLFLLEALLFVGFVIASVALLVVAAVAALLVAAVTIMVATVTVLLGVTTVLLALGSIYGLMAGISSSLSGGSFSDAFVDVFKGSVRAISSIFGIITGTVFGVVGYFVGGVIGLFDGGNWERGAERGWDIGYNAGFFMANLPGEFVINIVDSIQGREVDYPYYYRLSNFLMYCSRLAYQNAGTVIKGLPSDLHTDETLIFDVNDTQGYIAYHDEFILVAFRGTDTLIKDGVVSDFLGSFLRENWYSASAPFLFQQVALGFYEAYDIVRNQIHTQVSRLLNNNHRPVFVTGHSLGGALATMAALDITENFGTEVYCYTQAAPRAGNEAFTDLFNSEVHNCFMLQHSLDIVPDIPPVTYGYRHVDKEKVIGDPLEGKHSSLNYAHNIRSERSDIEAYDFLPDQDTINAFLASLEFKEVSDKKSMVPLSLSCLVVAY